ncbi:MAG TPA: hypothetical protein VFT36_12205 [Methylomirabilota bacterium]|nr:hypothetical protein [Methylomirabilota bacterium]
MAPRAACLLLAAALGLAGCAETRRVVHVGALPATAAGPQRTETQHRLDAIDCKAEMGVATNYNGDESPLANFLRNVFTLGAGGAALGGLVTGLPVSTESTATEGLIAGAGAGAIAGGAWSVNARGRFERAYVACMESRGYRVVATPEGIQ